MLRDDDGMKQTDIHRKEVLFSPPDYFSLLNLWHFSPLSTHFISYSLSILSSRTLSFIFVTVAKERGEETKVRSIYSYHWVRVTNRRKETETKRELVSHVMSLVCLPPKARLDSMDGMYQETMTKIFAWLKSDSSDVDEKRSDCERKMYIEIDESKGIFVSRRLMSLHLSFSCICFQQERLCLKNRKKIFSLSWLRSQGLVFLFFSSWKKEKTVKVLERYADRGHLWVFRVS